ncbi:MAG: ATPase [Sphingobacteriales bacterium]|nr:MAG: ATPase [Sphingobacteriales bacterium]
MNRNTKRIVVIGPESTGKSTLSEALADALHTVWVPEYARQYLLDINRPYTEADLLEIAKGQITQEDKMAEEANSYLVCDTDLHVIKVWSEHSYSRCHRWVLEQIATRRYDLYLFTDIDVEWVDDPLREHPGPWRQYFYHVYHDIVQNTNTPWALISGSHEERLQKALTAVRQHGL